MDIDRKCLEFAWQIVNEVRDQELGRHLRNYSRRARSMLIADGLAATLAFAYSRRGREEGRGREQEAWRRVFRGVVGWLAEQGLVTSKEGLGVFKELADMEEWDLNRATYEAARLLGWLSRLCEGRFEG